MRLDPFNLKKYSKLNPLRLAFTGYARGMEAYAGIRFDRVALELVPCVGDPGVEPVARYAEGDTAVTPAQMAALLHFLRLAVTQKRAPVVEIGSYRGVTTSLMAGATDERVFAVDPFIGYGGAEEDYQVFLENTKGLENVEHLRMTSGQASERMGSSDISFLFVDAVHDYVNTVHDVLTWSDKVVSGGYIAMHDTDNRKFPGTRLAAWEVAKEMELALHIFDLVILKKP